MAAENDAQPGLTADDVTKVAMLGRLALSGAELSSLTQELSNIVGFVSQLSEVDTAAVEPLAHPLDSQNVFRADEPAASLSTEQALAYLATSPAAQAAAHGGNWVRDRA